MQEINKGITLGKKIIVLGESKDQQKELTEVYVNVACV